MGLSLYLTPHAVKSSMIKHSSIVDISVLIAAQCLQKVDTSRHVELRWLFLGRESRSGGPQEINLARTHIYWSKQITCDCQLHSGFFGTVRVSPNHDFLHTSPKDVTVPASSIPCMVCDCSSHTRYTYVTDECQARLNSLIALEALLRSRVWPLPPILEK